MLDSTNSSRISAEFVARARWSKTTSGGSALVATLAVWCASVTLLPSFASAQTGGCSRPPLSLVQRFNELDCAFNCGDGYKNSTNDEEEQARLLAWNESYLMMAYMAMYDATLDVYYLRKLVDHADSVLLNTDKNRGVTDYTGFSGPCWRDFFDSDNPRDGIRDAYACWVVHSGMITYPMVRFAAIVLNGPSSLQTMLAWDGIELQAKANHYVTEVKRTVDHHEPQWFDDAPYTGTGHYRFPGQFPDERIEGWNAPWNYQHGMGRTLLALADALEAINDPVGALFYRDMATKMATLFTLTTPVKFLCADGNGSYIWNYANYGHCSTECEETCSGSSCDTFPGKQSRGISHAAIDVDFATVAKSYGVVFSEVDMYKFAATYVKNIVKNDPLWDEVWDTVDGWDITTGNPETDHTLQSGRWLNLSPWDTNGGIYLSVQAIYDNVFTGQADTYEIGWQLLVAANLARWEGAFKMYGVRTGPGSGSLWADVTAADLNDDGTDLIVGIRNFDRKVVVYDYDPTPSSASTDRIGSVQDYTFPSNVFNLAAVTSGEFENNGVEKVAVLAQNNNVGNNAWIYFLDYDAMGVLDPVGDTSMGGEASGFVGMGAGEFQSGAGTWAAVVRNFDDRFSLYKFTFDAGTVTATLQGSHFTFSPTTYQWVDLAVGDFDGDGLAEIAAIGNDPNEIVNSILVVLEWSPVLQQLVEVARNTNFGPASDLAAVTAADLNGDGVDEILMARNFDGTVYRYDLGQYTITQSDKGVPYGASKSYGGLAGGRYSSSSSDEFLVSMSNRTGDIHLYGIPGDCPWDLDCDGTVGTKDLLILLGAWGPCPVKGPCQRVLPSCEPDSSGACAADFDGDGTVGVADYLALSGNWGACP